MRHNLKVKLAIPTVAFSISPVLFISQNIQTYIDPGTGSLIIQVLIASFIGGLFLIKVFWRRIKTFFDKLFGRADKGDG